MWPGLTPAQIWKLSFTEWLVFAMGADDWIEQQKKKG